MQEVVNNLLSESDLNYVLQRVGRGWYDLDNKKIFISGATGIIGKWLISTLDHARKELALNIDITCLSRNYKLFANDNPRIFGKIDINWINGDVRDFKFSAAYKFDYAIHAATDVVADVPYKDVLLTCSQGTENIFEQLSSAYCKRVLLISSGAVYGKVPQGVQGIPEAMIGGVSSTNPASAYAEGKRYSELLTTLMGSECGIETPIARCFAMVGPYLPLDKHFAIGNFINSVLNNKPIVINGSGAPIRSYLYLADVVSQLWILLFAGRSTAYNVGSDTPISIYDLAKKVIEALSSNIPIHVLNNSDQVAHADSYYPDTSIITREFNLGANIPLNEAIKKTAAWYSGYLDKR